MKVALINTISKTIDRPLHWWQLFGRTLDEPLKTDGGVNFIRMAHEIAGLGPECHVFVSDVYRPQESAYKTNNLKIHYLKTILKRLFPPAYLPLLKGLYKELKDGGYDIIQSSELMQPSTITAAIVSRRIFVWQEQDQYSSRMWLRIIQRIYFNILRHVLAGRMTLVPRSDAAKSFLEHLRFKKISDTIPSGIDISSTFHPLDMPEEYLLVVSRIAPDKGFDFLLKAILLVKRDIPQVKLLIKGDGPYRACVEDKIVKYNLGKNVTIDTHFTSQKELNIFYNRAFFTIIPTRGGLFPFVALESLAAGKPVVSSFARSLKGIILNGRTGFLVDTETEMAERICHLLKNEGERQKMGLNALEIIKNYDITLIAKKFVELYRCERSSKHV